MILDGWEGPWTKWIISELSLSNHAQINAEHTNKRKSFSIDPDSFVIVFKYFFPIVCVCFCIKDEKSYNQFL